MDQVMKSIKRISYYDEENETIDIYIEEVLDAAYGCYIWPSALVLAEFVWHNRKDFQNTTVLEVGAGTSLPSLVLAKALSEEIKIVLSDIPDILPVVQGCLDLNDIESDVWVSAIEWGQFGTENSIDQLISRVDAQWATQIDYILGSDTFYEPSQFENLLVLVSYVIHRHNPNCKFYTTYQERSPKRSIQYLLDKWKLQCRQISLDSFDFDQLKYIDAEDESSEVKVSAGTLGSVFLLEISMQP